ncbi:MAG: hypothetical protein M1834_007688 [Cirrosporium novae-zelandiae]|nr:MAG: hypothetical protein M1834_007688 [Cirrosporium novae-zelandiae]
MENCHSWRILVREIEEWLFLELRATAQQVEELSRGAARFTTNIGFGTGHIGDAVFDIAMLGNNNCIDTLSGLELLVLSR